MAHKVSSIIIATARAPVNANPAPNPRAKLSSTNTDRPPTSPMLSPFPGMDPYLEQPTFWPSFHSKFVVAMADAIESQLSAPYYVEVETRSYLHHEETVNERYLEIRETASDSVVTAIELLSPTNKRAGDGRKSYEAKRNAILSSLTHLVEVDLIRAGVAMPMAPVRSATHYHVLVSRSFQRPEGDLYAWTVREQLPTVPIPLARGEAELIVDLQAVFEGVYRRSRYATRIGYQQPVPPPKLARLDQEWTEQRLATWRRET